MRTALLGWLAAIIALAAACYQPTLPDCVVACRASTDCAAGQTCGADGLCASPMMAGRCAAMVDAGAVVPGPPLPPAPTCDETCPGTCEDGTCVIRCGAQGCALPVRCPAGVPCEVLCEGKNSCAAGVRCGDASRCAVVCAGESSCRESVECGEGACGVACTGKKSCREPVRCDVACACDVVCTGQDACRDGSVCHDEACIVGDACSSAPAGCDAC